ncbi:MAG: S-layer homology domain-containing protein [Caryophanon sp.]|nr:S-layer homology domain-containing protein [Caryophanon sp.]
MNKYVLALTATAMTASVVAPVASANGLAFNDLTGYAQDTTDAVKLLVDKKIVNGTTATTFSPNAEITRGQVVKILGRYLLNVEGQTVPADWNTKARFSDVPVNHKDEELVKLAALCFDAGIFTGSEGKLMTAGTMSRENLALVVNRLAKQMTDGQDLVALAAGKPSKVTDLAKAKEESRAAITALNALNISNVAEFNPKGTVKRVHFASLVAKLLVTVEALQAAPEEPTAPVVDEAVKAFEEAVNAVNIADVTAEVVETLVAQYNALSAAQKAQLSPQVAAIVKAVEDKLAELQEEAKPEEPVTPEQPTNPTPEQPTTPTNPVPEQPTTPTNPVPEQPTTPVEPTPPPKTDAEVLADKIAAIGPAVSNADITVQGSGSTVSVTIANPNASIASFMGLYGSIVQQLGIVKVNGYDPNSFSTIGYLGGLVSGADTLGDLKGQTFNIPVVVNNTGKEFSTTISIQLN